MNKSIYDEALEIIDKNTFELGKGLDVLKPTYRDTVVKALEQAQKQEKLLDLYREYFRISRVPKIAQNRLTFNRLLEVQKEIKELEK